VPASSGPIERVPLRARRIAPIAVLLHGMRVAGWRHAPLSLRLDGDRRRNCAAPSVAAPPLLHAARLQTRLPVRTCASPRHSADTPPSFRDAGSEPSSSNLPPNGTFLNSASNAYVKHAVRVSTSRSYREDSGTGLLAGGGLLSEVAQALSAKGAGPLRPRVLLLAEGAPVPEGVAPDRLLRASPEVLRKARVWGRL
jgi:hypothetical protein